MCFVRPILIVLALAVAISVQPRAAVAADKGTLHVYPAEVNLTSAVDRQRVLAVFERDDGVTRDLTLQARLSLADPSRARLADQTVYPKADGKTMLTVEAGGQQVQIPVMVVGTAQLPPVSFKLDVMPIFMRAGCNSGACHGSARGQDGFRLSLFGFDPDGDHFRLTQEIAGRRVNLALPAESLVLEKALGTVPHTGGKRFAADSEYAATLLKWLEAGAPVDPAEPPKVESVELYPPQMVLEGSGASQQLIVRAKYSDGSDRDVTHLALYLTNNDNSAPVTPDGMVAAVNPGEAFVMARFNTFTVGSQVIVLPAGVKYVPPSEISVNYIDELVGAKLRKLRILPAPLCSDAVFLRRISLDITGCLPTADEYRQFLADGDPAKRAKLIDRLLERKEFAEIWAMNWAELLMIRTDINFSYKSMFLYWDWLSRQIADNVPIDQMVRELLSATGGTFSHPATNFYELEKDTLKTAENVAQVFLGIRIQCAQCHNHPFDRWTLDDYYSFASFFSQVGRKQAEDYRETIVFNRANGEVKHPVAGRTMKPKFLGGPVPEIGNRDRREVVAQWITAPENPYFATSLANRVWAYFFGQGIVEPVDDFRVSNPPCNPELLAALGQHLREYHYDFKHLVRDICNSHAYQRATGQAGSNPAAQRNFAQAKIRRLRAEILLDCISQVTETKDKFRGLPQGARAVEIADGSTTNYFLTTFGRAPRQTVCACGVRTDPTLSQALHLLNGETIQQKINNGGLIRRAIEAKQPPEEVIRDLHIRCFTREPTPAEVQTLVAMVQQSPSRPEGLKDVFWALLNAKEFVFNH
jgi:hypothetical protein